MSFEALFTFRTGKCSSNEFYCISDDKCISDKLLCDGIKDCFNGEDEFDCHAIDCSNVARGCRCHENYRFVRATNSCEPINACLISNMVCGYLDHKCEYLAEKRIDSEIDHIGYRCACKDGFVPFENGLTCVDETTYFPSVLVNFNASLYAYMEDVKKVELVINDTVAVFDYHDANNYVIYVRRDDKNNTAIVQHFIRERQHEQAKTLMTVNDLASPISHVAIDWIHELLYFSLGYSVFAMDIAQPDNYVLVLAHESPITNLEVNAVDGFIVFATEFGVYRADQDGTRILQLVALEEKQRVTLTLDIEFGKVYVLLSGKYLHSFDFYGQKYRKQLVSHRYGGIANVNSLSVLGEFLYIASDTELFRGVKHYSHANNYKLVMERTHISQIKVLHQSKQSPNAVNKCVNSNCGGICLPNKNNFSCFGEIETQESDTKYDPHTESGRASTPSTPESQLRKPAIDYEPTTPATPIDGELFSSRILADQIRKFVTNKGHGVYVNFMLVLIMFFVLP